MPPENPEITDSTPSNFSKGGSMHQKQPPAKVASSAFRLKFIITKRTINNLFIFLLYVFEIRMAIKIRMPENID